MKGSNHFQRSSWARFHPRLAVAWSAFLCLLFGAALVANAQAPMTEYQVKALCLFNFAKYVDWPGEPDPQADAPISIAMVGNSELVEMLTSAVKGRTIAGHPIAIQVLRADDAVPHCSILFISSSENKHAAEFLRKVKGQPVLTVGEGAAFEEAGGMISFVLRNGKVRFDIDLAAAQEARLRISSKLLTLADTVKGRRQ